MPCNALPLLLPPTLLPSMSCTLNTSVTLPSSVRMEAEMTATPAVVNAPVSDMSRSVRSLPSMRMTVHSGSLLLSKVMLSCSLSIEANTSW